MHADECLSTAQDNQIDVYSDLASVELFINGVSQGRQSPSDPYSSSRNSFAAWTALSYAPGNLTAVGYNGQGQPAAAHTVLTSQPPTQLLLSIDAPSNATGTGDALLADGQDVALLRATVADARGRRVNGARNPVMFRIVSGPGRVMGTHSGNTSSHENNCSPQHNAYHGLVRAVVQVGGWGEGFLRCGLRRHGCGLCGGCVCVCVCVCLVCVCA